jgi:hypothetical protein
VLLNDGIYYLMDGNRYLTNTNVGGSGGTPVFREAEEPKSAHEWKITVDKNGKNCYKIVSNADNRYINEYGVFGTNQYYSDWNTYLLTLVGDKWSLMWTQSAAKNGAQYIVIEGNRLEAKNVALAESYTLKIVAKETDTSVKDMNAIVLQYNGKNVTASEGTESIAVYSIDGRKVKESNGNAVATAELAKGVYIAVATGKNCNASLQFIIE